jgi:L-asparagine oxygenase
VFDQDLMMGITEEAEQMIQKIVDVYYRHRISHNLSPGEILFVDNRRAVHGRSPFVPQYNGEDRFLLRCFSVFDYEKTRYARPENQRVVATIFS